MTKHILNRFISNKANGVKSFAVLIDPDKTDTSTCLQLIRNSVENKVDFFFVGGSLITGNSMGQVIKLIKMHTSVPVILFPGSNLHIDMSADALLFLSLISGRNPDFLIGQHVISAPILKKSSLEILPTGYILVDSGKQTTVSYMSNTTPIPYDKPEIAACTAMAGEMLGLKLMYLDAGSGAQRAISPKMISTVRKSVDVPLIVGGGIRSASEAYEAILAGADIIVIGNGIEKNPALLAEVSEKIDDYNKARL
jgi:putative glycerol-1-phosphate prenyltransferase